MGKYNSFIKASVLTMTLFQAMVANANVEPHKTTALTKLLATIANASDDCAFKVGGGFEIKTHSQGEFEGQAWLGFEKNISDLVSSNIVFLVEDITENSATQVVVDEAIVNFNLADQHTLLLGQFVLPFGSGLTHFVSDSPTLVEPSGIGGKWTMVMSNLELSVALASQPKAGSSGSKRSYIAAAQINYTVMPDWTVSLSLMSDSSSDALLTAKGDDAIGSGTSFALTGKIGHMGVLLETTKIKQDNNARYNAELSFSLGDMATMVGGYQQDFETKATTLLGCHLELEGDIEVKVEARKQEDDVATGAILLSVGF